MDIYKLHTMKGGWFVGNFEPTAFKTEDFEAALLVHHGGENHHAHYHAKATEINLLLEGEMTIQEKRLYPGDIFILHPYEVADPIFHKDCKVMCIKLPSKPGDKYIVPRPDNHPLKDKDQKAK